MQFLNCLKQAMLAIQNCLILQTACNIYITLLVAVYESKALSRLGLRFLGVLPDRIVTPQIGSNPGPRYDAIHT